MKYGLRFTTINAQSWFDVWCENEKQRDKFYKDIHQCDWKENAFDMGQTLINLNYMLTVQKIEG